MTRVLLIEDDAELRDTLADGLRVAGFRVTAVTNGREGLEAFAAAPPGVVVTDVVMDEVEGVELVRALAGDVPMVAISGNPVYLRHCLAFGAAAALQKPFRMPALVDAVTTALAAAE